MKRTLSSLVLTLLGAACAAIQSPPAADPARYADIPRYEAGGAITAPEAIRRVEPLAPEALRQSTSYAAATIEAVIDANGNVVDAWQIDGNRQWAEVFIAAVRGWKFKPATLDGKPIAVRYRLTSTFRSTSRL